MFYQFKPFIDTPQVFSALSITLILFFLLQPLLKYRVPSYICIIVYKTVSVPQCEVELKDIVRKEKQMDLCHTSVWLFCIKYTTLT